MSESPEVERGTQNPKGKTNVEKTSEDTKRNTDSTEPAQVSNPKQSPSGNLENAGQTDNTKSA